MPNDLVSKSMYPELDYLKVTAARARQQEFRCSFIPVLSKVIHDSIKHQVIYPLLVLRT